MLPGKAERALRYEFICKMGGPPEFRYCNGEWAVFAAPRELKHLDGSCMGKVLLG